MTRRGETMTYRTSFDEFYASKLEALKVQLKGALYSDTPFVVGPEYACKICAGRLKLHSQFGNWYCLRCALQPGATSPRWSKATKAKIEAIMQSYPDPEQCMAELPFSQGKSTIPQPPREPKANDSVAFGARVEEARQALEMSQEELAAKIFKKDGENISRSTINMVERGHQNCSLHIREQLEEILGLKEGVIQG